MAGNVNKVFLMGNLTRDIELRQLPSGMSVGAVGLAVNERYKNREEQWVERANFIDCEVFGRKAEVMQQYLHKGRPVFIEGKLRLDQWQDKDGNNRSKLKVVIDDFQFVDSGQGGSGGGGGGGGGGARQPAQARAGGGGNDGGGAGAYGGGPSADSYEPIPDDDIPF